MSSANIRTELWSLNLKGKRTLGRKRCRRKDNNCWDVIEIGSECSGLMLLAVYMVQ
jgi:hypothetical protein